MPTQSVDALVEGGKATAGPPIGPALGPLGVNIGQVVAEINKKTASFKGMQVPVKISVDVGNKTFEISVGTPPASALVIKEAGIAKGSSNPELDKVADLKIEQIIKISKMKQDSLSGKTTKERVKEIIGTCASMGVMVEGKPAREAILDINKGAFANEIELEKTELSAEELRELEEERKKLAEDIERRRGEFISKAKTIIESMVGKPRGEIKGKLVEAGVPNLIIDELLPVEAAAAAPGEEKKEVAKPAAEKKEEKKK